jgi:hypothetical protein
LNLTVRTRARAVRPSVWSGCCGFIFFSSGSKLIHSVQATAANIADSRVMSALLHGNETEWGATRRTRARPRCWQNLRPGYRPHQPSLAYQVLRVSRSARREPHQSKTRSRVEHIFATMKLQFGFSKVRFRGLAKNLIGSKPPAHSSISAPRANLCWKDLRRAAPEDAL